MYFRDEDGRLWLKEGDEFRNIGLRVKEKQVVFNKIESMQIIPGSIKVPSLENPIPVTIREAIKQLGVSESRPLHPLKEVK